MCVCVCVCVCVCTRIGKKRGGKWNGGHVPSMVNGLTVMGKSLPLFSRGQSWRAVSVGGDGVDLCVQVGVKTLGGLVFV